MKTSDFFINVKEFIQNSDNWCKGKLAIDSEGNEVSPISSNACRWCLSGTIVKFIHDYKMNGYLERQEIFKEISKYMWEKYKTSIPRYNDAFGHENVLKFIDEYIEYCKSEGN